MAIINYKYTAFLNDQEMKYIIDSEELTIAYGAEKPFELPDLNCDLHVDFNLINPIENFTESDTITLENDFYKDLKDKIKAFILKHNNRNFICNTVDFCNSFAVLLFTFPSYTTIEMMEDKLVQFTIITHIFLALSNLTIILDHFKIRNTNQREFAAGVRDTFYAQLLPRAIVIGILGIILVGAGLTQKQPGLKYEPARNLLEKIALCLTHGNFRLFYAHTFQEVINLFRNRRVINTSGELNAIKNYEGTYSFWEIFEKALWFSSNPFDCSGDSKNQQLGTICGNLIFYIWAMITVGNELLGLLGKKRLLSEPYKGFGVYSHDTLTFLICSTGILFSATVLNQIQTSIRPVMASRFDEYVKPLIKCCASRLFPCCSEQENHETNKNDTELEHPLMDK